MKSMTIWQRLDTAVMLLMIRLLASVGIALWIQASRSSVVLQRTRFIAAIDRVNSDMLALTDSLRIMALDSKNENEKRRHEQVEHALRADVDQLQALSSEH